MKNLAKILLLAGALSLPFAASKAQEKIDKEAKSSIFMFIGSHKSSNNGLNEGYGNLLKIGGGFSANVAKSVRIGGRIGVMSKDRHIYEETYDLNYRYDRFQDNSLSMAEISATVDYLVPHSSGNYYIGAGFSIVNMSEGGEGKVEAHKKIVHPSGYIYYNAIPENTQNVGGEITKTNMGAGLFFGVEFDAFNETKIFTEVSGRFAGDDLGGFAIKAGFRQSL